MDLEQSSKVIGPCDDDTDPNVLVSSDEFLLNLMTDTDKSLIRRAFEIAHPNWKKRVESFIINACQACPNLSVQKHIDSILVELRFFDFPEHLKFL